MTRDWLTMKTNSIVVPGSRMNFELHTKMPASMPAIYRRMRDLSVRLEGPDKPGKYMGPCINTFESHGDGARDFMKKISPRPCANPDRQAS